VQDILKTQSIILLVYDAIICCVFIYLAYEMSDMRREFSIRNELLIVITIWVLNDLFYLTAILKILYGNDDITKEMLKEDRLGGPFLNYSRYLYIQSLLLALLIVETGLRNVRRSYKPNEVAPYPLNNEAIRNFDLAVTKPSSMKQFFNYLEALPDFREPLIMYGLHYDIVEFNEMVAKGEEHKTLHAKAVDIFDQYIVEDCQWQLEATTEINEVISGRIPSSASGFTYNSRADEINNTRYQMSVDVRTSTCEAEMLHYNSIPVEILDEIRSGYMQDTKTIHFLLNEGLFTDLDVFAVERLRIYYDQFKDSGRPFNRLRREVVEQEVLYEILRRYDLV
jgi:hypothetical protein